MTGTTAIIALLYPVSPDIWTGVTIQLISTSSDMPEPPTSSSPLHPVSRTGSREARKKHPEAGEIPSSKLQIPRKSGSSGFCVVAGGEARKKARRGCSPDAQRPSGPGPRRGQRNNLDPGVRDCLAALAMTFLVVLPTMGGSRLPSVAPPGYNAGSRFCGVVRRGGHS